MWQNIKTGDVIRLTNHVRDNIWSGKSKKSNFVVTEFELRKRWRLLYKEGKLMHQYKSKLYEVLYNDGEELAAIPVGEKSTAGQVKIYKGKQIKKFVEINEDISKNLFFGLR